jgi:hypothetical protein
MTNHLESSRQNGLSLYCEKFGRPFPRPLLGKLVANMGRTDVLSQMLKEQVEKGVPVENWDDFAHELLDRLGLKRKVPTDATDQVSSGIG